MSVDQTGWEGLLDPDEHIIWQGRPSPKVQIRFNSLFEVPFFLFFTGFSIFWMAMAAQGGGVFWMFGLLFFGVGAYNLVGQHFWKAYKRRKTFYSLSTKRAFIASEVGGRKSLKSYPITAETQIEMTNTTLGDIWFAHEYVKSNNGSTRSNIGFELLANPKEAYRMIRQIQQGALATHD